MEKEIQLFQPRFNVTDELCKKINILAGYQFYNNVINIDFVNILSDNRVEEDLLEFEIKHIGIEAIAYIGKSVIEQLLGAEIKHFDMEYIKYLITQHFARYGIHYRQYIKRETLDALPFLYKCNVIAEQWTATIMIDINSVNVESDYMYRKPQEITGSLPVSVSMVPFETQLEVNEIEALSTDDIVLVFPK